jgi:hypothetical protein
LESIFSKVFAVRRSTERHVSNSRAVVAHFLEGFCGPPEHGATCLADRTGRNTFHRRFLRSAGARSDMYRIAELSWRVSSKVFAAGRSTDRHVSQIARVRTRFLEGICRLPEHRSTCIADRTGQNTFPRRYLPLAGAPIDMYRRSHGSEHVSSKVFAACRSTTWAPNSRTDLERTHVPRELTWAPGHSRQTWSGPRFRVVPVENRCMSR